MTSYEPWIRSVEETKALRQTVGLGFAGKVSGGVLRVPGIPQRAPSLMRSPTSQVPDGDLASALNDIKVRLDGLDRFGRLPSGGPPASLPERHQLSRCIAVCDIVRNRTAGTGMNSSLLLTRQSQSRITASRKRKHAKRRTSTNECVAQM